MTVALKVNLTTTPALLHHQVTYLERQLRARAELDATYHLYNNHRNSETIDPWNLVRKYAHSLLLLVYFWGRRRTWSSYSGILQVDVHDGLPVLKRTLFEIGPSQKFI